jgi:hypothetical protein
MFFVSFFSDKSHDSKILKRSVWTRDRITRPSDRQVVARPDLALSL